jgi:hypothetical protein
MIIAVPLSLKRQVGPHCGFFDIGHVELLECRIASAVVTLGAHGKPALPRDAVGLAVPGLDQPLAPEPCEQIERAVGQDMTLAREAVDMDNAAILAAMVADTPALGQHVQHALLAPGDIHVGSLCMKP